MDSSHKPNSMGSPVVDEIKMMDPKIDRLDETLKAMPKGDEETKKGPLLKAEDFASNQQSPTTKVSPLGTTEAPTVDSSVGSPRVSGVPDFKANFFQMCKSFPNPADHGGHIPTEQYIEAVIGLSEFLGTLGLVFWSVRTDIANNIAVVKHYWAKDKEKNKVTGVCC